MHRYLEVTSVQDVVDLTNALNNALYVRKPKKERLRLTIRFNTRVFDNIHFTIRHVP